MAKTRKKYEQSVHLAIAKYIKLQYPNVIFFSEPSGLRVTIGLRKLLKGLRSESKLPDLFIAEPRNQFAGLFIEIKASVDTLYTNDGGIRNIEHIKEQLEMLERLQNKGFKAVFGAGFDDCKEIIDEYLTPKTELSTEKIEIITCNNFGIDRNLIHSKSRRRELVMPRQVIMTIAYHVTQKSTKKSNRIVGLIFKLDHATVSYSRKTVKNLIETDKNFREKFNKILYELGISDLNIN